MLVTTLTKRMAEDLADYLLEMGVKVHYLHSEVHTIERTEILRDLRTGIYDVVVGINLLREGLDLPEVSLVAILDADKEGFLRSGRALIQTIGRAARVEGKVMYADVITESMQQAIDETNCRRAVQQAYNEEHGIEPRSIVKPCTTTDDIIRSTSKSRSAAGACRRARRLHDRCRDAQGRAEPPDQRAGKQMKAAVAAEFEKRRAPRPGPRDAPDAGVEGSGRGRAACLGKMRRLDEAGIEYSAD